MDRQQKDDSYSEQETERRVRKALLGARIAGHREMKDIPPKPRAKAERATRKTRKTA